jgi:integrase
LAGTLRHHLRLAGITRPQLLAGSNGRRHVWAHDLRATFITISLAMGKSETWIADRTGHKSSAVDRGVAGAHLHSPLVATLTCARRGGIAV